MVIFKLMSFSADILPGTKNQPNQDILVCDWLITSHVTQITCADWLVTLTAVSCSSSITSTTSLRYFLSKKQVTVTMEDADIVIVFSSSNTWGGEGQGEGEETGSGEERAEGSGEDWRGSR